MDNVMVQFLQLTVSFYRKTDVWKQFFFQKITDLLWYKNGHQKTIKHESSQKTPNTLAI